MNAGSDYAVAVEGRLPAVIYMSRIRLEGFWGELSPFGVICECADVPLHLVAYGLGYAGFYVERERDELLEVQHHGGVEHPVEIPAQTVAGIICQSVHAVERRFGIFRHAVGYLILALPHIFYLAAEIGRAVKCFKHIVLINLYYAVDDNLAEPLDRKSVV